jgi:hypothetical protein
MGHAATLRHGGIIDDDTLVAGTGGTGDLPVVVVVIILLWDQEGAKVRDVASLDLIHPLAVVAATRK